MERVLYDEEQINRFSSLKTIEEKVEFLYFSNVIQKVFHSTDELRAEKSEGTILQS